MKMNEKIRTILITVAATLTVELFIFVILGSMGVTTVNFGGNATSANKDGNNTVTAEINDDVRKSSTSATSTTTVSTTASASSTSAAKSTAATGKTTKGNNKNTTKGNNKNTTKATTKAQTQATTKAPATTTTTKAPATTTTTKAPTTTTTQENTGDNDGEWVEGWY